jgi:hypothetical protein
VSTGTVIMAYWVALYWVNGQEKNAMALWNGKLVFEGRLIIYWLKKLKNIQSSEVLWYDQKLLDKGKGSWGHEPFPLA